MRAFHALCVKLTPHDREAEVETSVGRQNEVSALLSTFWV